MSLSPSLSEPTKVSEGKNQTGESPLPVDKKRLLVKWRQKILPTAQNIKPSAGILPLLSWRLLLSSFLALIFLAGTFYSRKQLGFWTGQINEKRSQWLALSEKDLSLKKLSQDVAGIEGDLDLLNNAFPDEESMIGFFSELERIEAESQVKVNNLNFNNDEPKKDASGFLYFGFVCEVVGEKANLTGFFQRLFALPILIRARTVGFEDIDQEESRLIFQAKIYVKENFYRTNNP